MFWSRTVGSYRVTALAAFMVSVALCTCTVLLLIIWAEPLLDDFYRASFAVDSPQATFPAYPLQRGSGIINYIIWYYSKLGGRWAATGFATLIVSTTGLPGAYPWVLFTLIVMQYLFLYLARFRIGVPIYIFAKPPGRTLDFIYGVFLIGWITLAFLLRRPHSRFSLQPACRVTTLSSALFLFYVLELTSNNTVTGMLDIVSGRARSWSAEMNNRFKALKTAGRSGDLLLALTDRFGAVVDDNLREVCHVCCIEAFRGINTRVNHPA
jgi:hypothetical protein